MKRYPRGVELTIGCGFWFVVVPLLVVWYSWPDRYSPDPPWWYQDSQVGWIHDNAIPAVGADDISQKIIDFECITRSTADGTVYAMSFNRYLIMQHQDDKNDGPIKLRYATGYPGFFAGFYIEDNQLKDKGKHQIHPPLTEAELRSMTSHWDDQKEREEYIQDCLREIANHSKNLKAEKETP